MLLLTHWFWPKHSWKIVTSSSSVVLFLELHKARVLLCPLVPRNRFLNDGMREIVKNCKGVSWQNLCIIPSINICSKAWISQTQDRRKKETYLTHLTPPQKKKGKTIGLVLDSDPFILSAKCRDVCWGRDSPSISSSRPPSTSTCRLGSGIMKPSGM